ncbi:sentrin-specific protease 2 isoform X2 [Hoplias malabaricus]|uniref:sentrin-specific protease 2 isoform X2 n=1 Tax=Hoplias malabaricus TaxID=27720 RepID=UPI003461B538
MYEWIVDGLSSLFVPFSGGSLAVWPTDGKGDGKAPPMKTATSTAATDIQQPEQYRPNKRNYQSVHCPDGLSDHLEIKRPRHDVIVRVVKKTFAGIAGLFRLRQHRQSHHGNHKEHRGTQVEHVALMGIDEIHSNSLNKWMINGDVKMETQKEMGLTCKDRTGPSLYQNGQVLVKKPEGAVLYMGNQDRQREWPHRRSLQLLPSRTGLGLPEMEPPSRTHKPCLTVEEALKESDREHYRKLVEMVSEKYSKNKPLPFGRVKPPNTSFPVAGHKPFSRTTEISKPAPIRVNPNVSVWRDTTSKNFTKDRLVDVACGSPISDLREKKLDDHSSKKTVPVDVDLSVEVETRLNLKERETVAVSKPVEQTWPEPLPDLGKCCEEFPRLTKEIQHEVSAALVQRDPDLVLSSAFKLRITQRDLATLQEGSWLNDEVINFYLNLVMARSEQEKSGIKVYCFSTFFFPKLHTGGHAAVRRWTKAVDLFLYEFVFIPLHLGVHWSLIAVDFRTKSVRSYDSMGQRHDDICNLILMYLKEEYKVKKGKDLDVLKWTVTSMRATVPQQKNGSDCGVFVCKYADYIARGHPLTFRQCHMPYFRKAMIWEILKQRLMQ